MHSDRETSAPVSPNNRSKVCNGSMILRGVDQRSPNARRFKHLVFTFEAEAGGPASLTEADRALIKQAAGLVLRSEALQAQVVNGEPVDSDELIRLASTARRLLDAISAKAKKRKPAGGDALKAYLSERATEAA